MLREKRQNPFWVPSQNTDLFQLREMLNEEKNQNKMKKSEHCYTQIQVNEELKNRRKFRLESKKKRRRKQETRNEPKQRL